MSVPIRAVVVPSLLPVAAPIATSIATSTAASSAASTVRAAARWTPLLLAGCAVAAVGAAAWAGAPSAARAADADLVRLLRAMALIKGVMLATALAALGWRFRRPVATPFLAAYLLLGWSASAALGAMWQLAALGTAAVVLHGAGLALLLLATRDPDFLPRTGPAR